MRAKIINLLFLLWKILKPFWLTYRHLTENHLIEVSAYIAYAVLLAFFPFCIFLVAFASLFGETAAATQFIQYTYSLLPADVVQTLSPIVEETVVQSHGGVMTVAILGMLWVASSGVESIRTGLNTIYGIHIKERFPFWKRRLMSLFFVIVSVISILLVSFAVVVAPLIIQFMSNYFHVPLNLVIGLNFTRFLFALTSLIFFALLVFLQFYGLLLRVFSLIFYRTLPAIALHTEALVE